MSETRTITVTGTLVTLGDHEQEDGDMAHGMFISLSIKDAMEVGLSDFLLERVRITMTLER
jgi:hypothetical protein